MFDNLFNLVREGVVKAPVAGEFSLVDFREALAANAESRLGKVLFCGVIATGNAQSPSPKEKPRNTPRLFQLQI